MSMLRRSNRPHGGMNKVIKQESGYLADQIDEFKESKPVQDQLTDNQISEWKVDTRMGNNKFGSGVIELNTEVITIQAGEDIATKVMSFSGNGLAVCSMSANGAVSNVTLRQGVFSHETGIYEGYFEILSLSGLYHLSETDGMCSRIGGLSVSLAGLDGRSFGGGVEGPLTAGSPVQVIIGRFPVDVDKKLKLATESGTSASGSAGRGSGLIGLNSELITIKVGEDVATKVRLFSGNGSTVCILSAHGAVSNVTLRQGAFSHKTVVYEGYFEILSLSGLYQPSETDGMCSRTGGLSVSLAGHDGRVFGGGVAGPLTAASPVQVVIGRFPADEEEKLKLATASGIPGASSSTQRGALTGSFGRPTSPPK